MADKSISQLAAASTLYDNDLLVLEQSGTAKKMAGSVLKQYIVGQGGIDHITLNANYTLTITYTNGTEWTSGSIRGQIGQTGRTPEITASKAGRVTTLYSDGVAVAAINDGADGGGAGDMRAEYYDPDGVVLASNGIVDYAERNFVKKTHICNPNLLDNGWFTVNQRGETSYTGAVQYTVDRWKTTNANTSVYCLDSGIRIVNNTSGSAGYLLQVIDDYRQLLGRTVTYSVMLGDGRVISASAAMPSVAPTETTAVITLYDGEITIGGLMFYNVSGNTQLWARVWSNANENERAFVAVKLELGSQQTLAHQESGVWVLNEIPNYGEELRKCQRYFQRFRTQALRPTYCEDFRPTMRVDPSMSTITVGGVTYYTATADM